LKYKRPGSRGHRDSGGVLGQDPAGGIGGVAPFLLSNLSKCEVVLWLLAAKVKLRTNTSKAVVENI